MAAGRSKFRTRLSPLFRVAILIIALAWSFRHAAVAAQAETPSPAAFEKLVLTDEYLCDGINAGDFNRDGRPDVVAGPYWYEGPDFSARHEIFPVEKFERAAGPTNSLFSFVYDFNGDGWTDVLVLGRVHLHQAFWYENPQAKPGHWPKHYVFERVQGETPLFCEVEGSGRPALLALSESRWGLLRPDWTAPTRPWNFTPLTEPGAWGRFYHGEGLGDLNGDGRVDLVLNDGWWEQPAEGTASTPWKAHPYRFSQGRGGAQMYLYDVNGDGRNDVITALDAHGWGLAWFEQLPARNAIEFREHKIMGDRTEESKYGVAFSQPHALALADVDGDGLEDIVVGKRMWAHGPKGDVEPEAPPVLYWFQLVRGTDKGVTYVPHLIDDQSGVGLQVTVADLSGDGRPDVLTVSKLGAFVFLNRPAANGTAASAGGNANRTTAR